MPNFDWKKLLGLVCQLGVDFSKDNTVAIPADMEALVAELIIEIATHPAVKAKLAERLVATS